MGWLIFLGAMAFFGGVCILWTLSGWLIPAEERGTIFCEGKPGVQENGLIRRYLFLRDLDLLRWTLVVVDFGLSAPERKWLQHRSGSISLWTKEEYLRYLETERNRIDGTGNGDYSGRDQRCGIREL